MLFKKFTEYFSTVDQLSKISSLFVDAFILFDKCLKRGFEISTYSLLHIESIIFHIF